MGRTNNRRGPYAWAVGPLLIVAVTMGGREGPRATWKERIINEGLTRGRLGLVTMSIVALTMGGREGPRSTWRDNNDDDDDDAH